MEHGDAAADQTFCYSVLIMASDRHESLLSLALSYLSLRLNIPAESSAERRRSHAKHPLFPFSLPSAFYTLLSSSLVSPSASVSPGRQGHLPPTPSSSALVSPPVLSPCSHQLSPAGFREAARRGRPLRLKSTFRPHSPFFFSASFLQKEGDAQREKLLPDRKCTQCDFCPSKLYLEQNGYYDLSQYS